MNAALLMHSSYGSPPHVLLISPPHVLTVQAWREGLEGGEEEQEEGGGGAVGQEAGAQHQADVPAQGEGGILTEMCQKKNTIWQAEERGKIYVWLLKCLL